MGKGGYNGGSTIIYIKSSGEDSASNRAFVNNKTYLCEICNNRFIGESYFHHLLEHGMSGCTSCGKPYKDQGERVHCCQKCGKRTVIRLRNKEERGKSKKLVYPSKQKAVKACKIIRKSNKNKTIRSSHSQRGKQHSSKFCVSLGDILQEAMSKKGL